MSFTHTALQTVPSTSDALRPAVSDPPRLLRPEEQLLMRALLPANTEGDALRAHLPTAQVTDMADGGMGSLRFCYPGEQRIGSEVACATYLDSDGTPVEISVNFDRERRLFELHIWKVDYSPLKQFPKPEQLTFA